MWRISCILLLCICSSVALGAEKHRLIKADIPAAKLNALRLDANVGGVTITTAHDGAVHVKVTLTPRHHGGFAGMFHWSNSGKTTRLTGIKLKRSRNAHALALSLAYPGGVDHDDVKAKWRIAMPARLHFKAKVHVGELNLKGVAGGVDLNINVGKVEIHVPRGAIRVKDNVGEIEATSATPDRGDITLASDVGDAELNLPRSAKNVSRQRSGMVGKSVHVPGEGSDDMTLKTNVGKVELTVKTSSHGR